MPSPQQLLAKPPRPERAAGAQVPDEASIAHMLAEIARVEGAARPHVELLPARLSPSRAGTYKTCPLMFYYRTLVHLSSPPTEATTRGTVAHTAFERTFDHPAGSRTPELTKSYIRPAWDELTNPTVDPDMAPPGSPAHARAMADAQAYRDLAPAGSQTEAAILEFAEQAVDSWYAMERVNNFDPAQVTLPSGEVIDGREVHVSADMFGVTLHGFIDRLDMWRSPNGPTFAVSDYKTGRPPGAGKSYPQHVMDRIEWDAFFQLRIYAVLAWEMHRVPVSQLRLVYVTTGDRQNGIKTLTVTQDVISRTKGEVRAVWNAISRSARTQVWQPKVGKLCSWCSYLEICPAFAAPGTPAEQAR